ncbi:MAG: hypothetical protein KFF73_03740 [Cyclobacteriaceae bacterium]|nr:hypothetical protein [Cyclobacteriaceae bacterium]
MKLGIIILMVISLVLHSLNFVFIYVSFKMHQEYIAANLCVKKDEPANSCKGHCQLTKKMQNHEKQDKENPLIQVDPVSFSFLKPVNRFIFHLILSHVNRWLIFNSLILPKSGIHEIFHPPMFSFHLTVM